MDEIPIDNDNVNVPCDRIWNSWGDFRIVT
jgi:hypothetical protein